MNRIRWVDFVVGRLLWLALAAMLVRIGGPVARGEEHFDVLQIGTSAYTNVTVTTKAEGYIFIVHAGGMNNVKVSQLPPEVRQKLGYVSQAEKQKAETNAVPKWAKQVMPEARKQQLEHLERAWRNEGMSALSKFVFLGSAMVVVVLAIGFLVYVFFCYCSLLICRKAGHPPGILVWVPVLQLIPMLRAAGMSPVWFLAYVAPGVWSCFPQLFPVLRTAGLMPLWCLGYPVLLLINLGVHLCWCVGICKARGKSVWVALPLVLPLINLFAYLYLAFSEAGEEDEAEGKPQIMTLEAA